MKRAITICLLFVTLLECSTVALAAEPLPQITIGETELSTKQMTWYEGDIYVSVEMFLNACGAKFALSQDGSTMKVAGVVSDDTIFAISAVAKKNYVNVNGRYIYIAHGVRFSGKSCYLPLTVLLCATGCSKDTSDSATSQTYIPGLRSMTVGSEFYNETVVYWMAKTIYSEAGNQSLEGKIAVGNVIVNRVRSDRYPNTVTGVIFQKNQFSGVLTDNFKVDPPEECVIAAKIALEGTQIYHNVMYFNVAGMDTWAKRNRPFLDKLGGHDFYA